MKIIQIIGAVALCAAVVACGGGGGSAGTNPNASSATSSSSSSSGSSSTPTTTITTTTSLGTVVPSSIEILASANSLPSSTGSVAITVLVKDNGNNGISGQAVGFTASSGALQGSSGITNANGVATVNLVGGADKSNRAIVVTATAGSIASTLNVPVVGTSISVIGSGSLLLGSASSYVVRALDASGNPISNATISLRSSLSNPLSTTTVKTDSLGQAQLIYTPNSAGSDTLTASGLGATGSAAIVISGEDFAFTSPSAGTQVVIATTQAVTVRYRSGGLGVSGKSVTFSITRGGVNSAITVLTDGSGNASANVSSSTSGPAVVNATIAGLATTSGTAQSTLSLEFVATTPATLVLQATPGSVLPNSGGSVLNQSSLLATVRDALGNPVKNVAVSFAAVLDPSGGSLAPGSGVTDSNGEVRSTFISGASSSPLNGVTLRSSVTANSSIFGTTSLTVNGQALFITVAIGKTIEAPTVTTYSKPFSLYVQDATGAAVAAKAVSLTIYAETYGKGVLVYDAVSSIWTYSATSPTTCPNEDVNANGTLDSGEDTNGSSSLTPGGVAVLSSPTVTTDASGFAQFNLTYSQQMAGWARVRIRASATVSGTESSTLFRYGLQGLVTDYTVSTVAPAAQTSPFGVATVCTNQF